MLDPGVMRYTYGAGQGVQQPPTHQPYNQPQYQQQSYPSEQQQLHQHPFRLRAHPQTGMASKFGQTADLPFYQPSSRVMRPPIQTPKGATPVTSNPEELIPLSTLNETKLCQCCVLTLLERQGTSIDRSALPPVEPTAIPDDTGLVDPFHPLEGDNHSWPGSAYYPVMLEYVRYARIRRKYHLDLEEK